VRLPIRLRLALFSALLIAAVVIALGTFVYVRVEADLKAAVDDGLAERAQDLIDDPPAGSEIKGGSSDIGDVFALIASRDGTLVASTVDLDADPVLAAVPVAQIHAARYFEFDLPTDEEPQATRVFAEPGAADQVVVTGIAFDDQRATLDSLAGELAIAVPIAVILALLSGWLVGGAALRPVERMRVETEAISESEPDRRLSVPATGDELAALGRSLNHMLDRLQTAVDRERRVVDNASHELRTPLANLKAELDLALRRSRTETELLAALHSASDETDRLARLAADLLVLARAHRGRLPIRPQEVDIDQLVREAVAGFAGRAVAAGVTLRTEVPSGLRANLDGPRVRQALDNLIDNAIRHAGEGGKVVVSGERETDDLLLAVTDTGPGFAPEFIADAFEPFSRTDEGRARSDGGAGLGLAIVRAVAEAHGGSVSARNVPEGGAVVELRIPVLDLPIPA
jgi:two-component system OmpR family sensor kinase